MKYLVYETQSGEVGVIKGLVGILEEIVENYSDKWLDWNWFGAFGNNEETVKQVYESKKWYEKMVEKYGANEDNWPEEE